ncbi:unnamed protein product [Durusdinium trenchii]|uniref:Uncharacterized protein n=1 Tax=Durusdinium trenchii TaxID=1381693 RepID=A0ABP0M823_9DINO
MIIPPAAGQGARLPAPQATFSGSVPEPDSEVAPPEDDVPLAPWAAARVLPTSHARRTRRVSTPAGRFVGDEQKQLARWAEHLNEEVLALTRERDSLAGKLADANAANVKLQMELEHLRRVSAEFPGVSLFLYSSRHTSAYGCAGLSVLGAARNIVSGNQH